MSILFTPIAVGSLTVPNRFIRSATHDYLSDDAGLRLGRGRRASSPGWPRARSDSSSRATPTSSPSGKASPRQMGVFDDRFVAGLARIPGGRPPLSFEGLPPDRPRRPADQGTGLRRRARLSLRRSTIRVSKVSAARALGRRGPGAHRRFRRGRRKGQDGPDSTASSSMPPTAICSRASSRPTPTAASDEWGGTVGNRARALLEILRRRQDFLRPGLPGHGQAQLDRFPAGRTSRLERRRPA
ncbi:MAG: hypothetical protein M0C28_39120 [Candidatus Moduliflexus flocculans]|nr:hypothetical protein [Candidatus Moduliflexus flocculans]